MDMQEESRYSNGILSMRINNSNGQLTGLWINSLDEGGLNFMHDGGSFEWRGNGWPNSEIVAFPVFGPVPGYSVRIGDVDFPMDQHGISRNLGYELICRNKESISLNQIYEGQSITNPRFKQENKGPESLKWLPYEIRKKFSLREKTLEADFLVKSKGEGFHYMFAWHPAFNFLGDESEGVFSINGWRKTASLIDVMEESEKSGALFLSGAYQMHYENKETGRKISLETEGFRDLVLWSPGRDSGMFCIEPTTNLPMDSFEGFEDGKDLSYLRADSYKVIIRFD